MATIDVKDAGDITVAIEKPLAPGRAPAATSRPVALSNEDLAALSALGTQTTLAAVLAKISADPATQTTLAAILAKLIAAPATEAKQDTGNTSLASLVTLLSTQAGFLDGIETLITATNAKDFSTQTTLAAVLAKIIAAPATESKQDNAITQETAINTVLGTTAGAAVTTNVAGTIQQYLRGIVSLLVSGITVAAHAVTNAGTFAVQNTAATPAGTNAIGKLAANAGVNIGEVSIAAAQLANALTSYAAIAVAPAQQVAHPTDHPTMAVAPDTSRILNGASGVSLTPKWAFVDATTSGDTSVVALVSSKKIRVLFWEMSPNAAVNARFRSNTTSKTALYYMSGQGNGQRAGFNQAGWFETVAGEALNVNLSGAVNVGVLVGYVEV